MIGGMSTSVLFFAAELERVKEQAAAAKTSWQAMAERGLELDQEPVVPVFEKNILGPTLPCLRGTVDGCKVTVRILADGVRTTHTEFRARPAEPLTGVKIGVHPSPWGILGTIRSWLGQDIEVGDEAFDEAFLITGKPASAPPQVLDAPLREKLVTLNANSFAGLVFDGESAKVLMSGVITAREMVSTAIDVAVAVANWKP